MSVLPVVVYVEEDDTRFGTANVWKEALVHHLSKVCGCEMLSYGGQQSLLMDRARICQAAQAGRLLAAIVQELEYDDQHLVAITMLRHISPALPIVVMPQGMREEVRGVEGMKRIYRYYNSERRLPALITRWRRAMKIQVDYFGTEGTADLQRVTTQLQHAYEVQYLDGMELGVPDRNGQILAEAMRVRLFPGLISQEFDRTLRRDPAALGGAERLVFQEELRRIEELCHLDPEGRDLWFLLMDAKGDTCGGSQGEDAEGFAIDSETLEYGISSGFGYHKQAVRNLVMRLQGIDRLRRREKRDGHYYRRILSGLLLRKVEGFTLPVVLFLEGSLRLEDEVRVRDFLHGKMLAMAVLNERNTGMLRMLGERRQPVEHEDW